MNDNWVIAGERNTLPKVGGIYEVRHSRKGTFDLQVKAVNGEWLTGVVVGGVAKAAMSYNVKYEGARAIEDAEKAVREAASRAHVREWFRNPEEKK